GCLPVLYSGEMNRLNSGALKSGSGIEKLLPLGDLPDSPAGCFSGDPSGLVASPAGESADEFEALADLSCQDVEADEVASAAVECVGAPLRGQASTTLDRQPEAAFARYSPVWCPRDPMASPTVSTATNTAPGLASNLPPALRSPCSMGFMPAPPAGPLPWFLPQCGRRTGARCARSIPRIACRASPCRSSRLRGAVGSTAPSPPRRFSSPGSRWARPPAGW